MKKTVIILAILIIIAVGSYFIFYKPEPKPVFVSKDEIDPAAVVIRITDTAFEPSNLEIKKGQKVVWVNETNDYVWPASNLHPTHEIYPEFEPQEPFDPGLAWAFEFKKSGEWEFHDHLKPSRRGIIKVKD